eukprot:Clim_evm11s234 gene=Clim_evmTU11s234
MAGLVIAIEMVILAIGTFYFMNVYMHWRESPWYVTAPVFIVYFFSFCLVLLIPLDVSSAFYQHCIDTEGEEACEKPIGYVSEFARLTLWRMFYWTIFINTFLILPGVERFLDSGEFSTAERVRASIKRNALFYSIGGIVGGLLFIYIAITQSLAISGLIGVAQALANTWGLFLVVILLGYGLVEIPRSLWESSRPHLRLRRYQWKAANQMGELDEAEDILTDAVEGVKQAAAAIQPSSALYKYIREMQSRCPDRPDRAISSRRTQRPRAITKDYLADLNTKLMIAVKRINRAEANWELLLEEAFEVEDTIMNHRNVRRAFISAVNVPEKGTFAQRFPTIHWWWNCRIEPYAMRLGAVVMTLLSLILIWSEVVFFLVNPTLSVYALIIGSTGKNYDYTQVQFWTFLGVVYMSCCAYFAIFQVKVLNMYHLVPKQRSDDQSMIFSANMMARLAAPLCLNFLTMSHMDGVTIDEEPAFVQILGHLKVVGFIESGFNVYYPMFVLVVAAITYFNLFGRILGCLGGAEFFFGHELSFELVEEGREYLVRARRERERKVTQTDVMTEYSSIGGLYRDLILHGRPSSHNSWGRTSYSSMEAGSNRNVELPRLDRPRDRDRLSGNDSSSVPFRETSPSKGGTMDRVKNFFGGLGSSSGTRSTTHTRLEDQEPVQTLGVLESVDEDDLPILEAPDGHYNRGGRPDRNIFDDF